MTIEEIYEAMKNVSNEEMKRLDNDQRIAWRELVEYLKLDFDEKEKLDYDQLEKEIEEKYGIKL